MIDTIEKTKKFVSLKQIPEIHPAFTLPSLRWIIFNVKHNGSSMFIKRVGKKIVISLSDFEKWIEQQDKKNNEK